MSRKLKNAIMLAYDFYPSEGGIQTFMRSLVSADLGIKWIVLARQADDHLDLERPYRVVRTAMRPQLRIIDKLWLKIRGSRFTVPELIAFQTKGKLTQLGKRTKADFLLADQFFSARSISDAAQTLGIPWVLVTHGKEILDENQEARRLLWDANLVIANSTYTKELAKQRGAKEEQIKVLHPTVDTDYFKPPTERETVRRQLAVNGRETLVTVAHLVQRKGHAQVIQALPAIKKIYPNVIYLVVGRGPCEDSLSDLAKDLGVSDAVRFCGYVPVEELPLYYGAADIHIMASTCDGDVEGFGISFIEAAACGTPSVGSRSGGIPDAIADGETGFLIEPGDVRGLSKLIVDMLDNKNLREQMGFSARKMVEMRFSRNAFAQSLMSSFNQTVLSGQD